MQPQNSPNNGVGNSENGPQDPPPLPPCIDVHNNGPGTKRDPELAKQHAKHHASLKRMLGSKVNDQSSTSARARWSLVRLSNMQFAELTTDVYDEIERRQLTPPPPLPYLLPSDSYHPKRNQARSKLSALQPSRFSDLVQDVYEDLERRYPYLRQNGGPVSPAVTGCMTSVSQSSGPGEVGSLGSGRMGSPGSNGPGRIASPASNGPGRMGSPALDNGMRNKEGYPQSNLPVPRPPRAPPPGPNQSLFQKLFSLILPSQEVPLEKRGLLSGDGDDDYEVGGKLKRC